MLAVHMAAALSTQEGHWDDDRRWELSPALSLAPQQSPGSPGGGTDNAEHHPWG